VGDRAVDRVALAFGISFVVAGVMFLLDRLDVWELEVSYVLPVFLIALGVGLLVGGRSKEPPSAG